jgi:hypothetical protein
MIPERSAADARAFELQIVTNKDGSRRYTSNEVRRILIGEGLTDEKGERLK